MPNYCNYKMKIRGPKAGRDAWIEKMNDYEQPNHFWRIFEVYEDNETPDSIELSGYCAWSIESCCRASGYSGGTDLFEVNSKDLDLVVEVWSEEDEGGFFQEHYIYNKGICEVDESLEFRSLWWDKDEWPKFEDYKTEFDLEEELTEDMFDEDGYYHDGGFGDGWGEWYI